MWTEERDHDFDLIHGNDHYRKHRHHQHRCNGNKHAIDDDGNDCVICHRADDRRGETDV